MNKLILGASMVVSATTLSFAQQVERPNIVIVLADDLGWGDVGFHGSEIKTPCLNALAAEGVVLDRFYTAPISTPTRAGLMTGRYPNRFGIRTTVIPPWSFSQCSRFIQNNDIYFSHLFQSHCIFNQNMLAGSFTYTHHQRSRCSKPQSTWTSNDKNRNSRQNTIRDIFTTTNGNPQYKCQNGNA